ncbi:MAG TPA: peptidyl-prolyl cis-trans isomerase [Polyangiales bacterium]|nr:peptidyl-prolyl cis-trans isomerase [Polyangiales bacterium]
MRKRFRWSAVLCLSGVLTPARAEPPPDAAAEAAQRAQVVATFEGGQVTVGDLEDALSASGAFGSQRYLDKPALQALLDRSLRFELLAAEAERRGYGKNSNVVQAIKQNAVQAMLKQEVDAKVTPKTVPAAAVQKYYDEHIDEFVRPELRRASLVLVPTEAEANGLLEQAKAADARGFRELARLHSKDETSRLRGGDLRYFDAKGKPDDGETPLDAALVKPVFALKDIGDTTGVVKTTAGFAILKLTGLRAAHAESAKQADERIRMRLWREQREAAIDAMLVELRQQYKPVLHPELIDSISFSTDTPEPPNAGLPAGFPHTRPPPVPIPKN